MDYYLTTNFFMDFKMVKPLIHIIVKDSQLVK